MFKSYFQLHILTQGNLSVEEYISEFEKLVIKCDLQEPEEQTIVRYLGGLDPRYANVVDLQAYTTFDEVCVCWLMRLSSKRKQGSLLNPKIQSLIPETNPLTRGVIILLLSRKIHFLPFHKEPQLHKRSKRLKIGLIPIP